MKRSVDSASMSSLVSRPGVDPRVWLTLATVEDIGYDAKHGLFADVAYIPDGQKETAAVGTPYAAPGAGLVCPFGIGDVVLVAVPNGDTGHGPRVIAQGWNETNTPPPEAQSTSNTQEFGPDVVWRFKKGIKYKMLSTDGEIDILVDGAGKVNIVASGSGDIDITNSGSGDINVAATGGGKAKMTSTVSVTVDAPQILLGANAKFPIARIGDTAGGNPITAQLVPPTIVLAE